METRFFAALSLIGGLLWSGLPASAQTYPSRPIKFVVPFSAGSATDALARIVGAHVSKTLGQPVVVENMAGANCLDERRLWLLRSPGGLWARRQGRWAACSVD